MKEVVSQGQTVKELQDKLTTARQQLGKPGIDQVFDPDPLPAPTAVDVPNVTPQPSVAPVRTVAPAPETVTPTEVVEPVFLEIP